MMKKVIEKEETTPEIERYLVCLYEGRELGNSRLSTTEISELLNLHPATVSNRLKNLDSLKIDDYKIFDYEPRYGAKLTYFGLEFAGQIVRKKRIEEVFLKCVGLPLDEINTQIQKIHFTSIITDAILANLLSCLKDLEQDGNTKNLRCPHGGLIPDKKGVITAEVFYPLDYFPKNSELTIHRLPNCFNPNIDHENFSIIQKHQIHPGSKIKVLKSEKKISQVVIDDSKMLNLSNEFLNSLYYTDKNYSYEILSPEVFRNILNCVT